MTQQRPGPDYDWSWVEAEELAWVPPTIDVSRPSAARMYDYALGGKDNFEVDRQAAHKAYEVMPDGPALAQANRGFLVRAVTAMASAGIRQFIDLGTGIPTSPSVHEVARLVHPEARVAYVDNDPIVLAHSRAMLDGDDRVSNLMHDLRDPAAVLTDPRLTSVIRMDEPVGLLMIAVLHFVDLSIAPEVVKHYLSRLVPGSQLAFTVGTREGVPAPVSDRVEQIYRDSQSPIVFRTRAEIEQLVDGLVLTEPGMTEVTQWRTDGTPGTMRMLAGLGVKP